MNATFLERAKDRDRRGAVLGLVLVVVVVFSILGFGLLSQGMMDAVETSKAIASAQAYWAAETGIEQTRALGMRGKVPFEQIPGFALDRNGTNGASSFRVLVTADPFNAFSITQRYEIVSTGTAQGGVSRTVTVHAEIEDNWLFKHLFVTHSEERPELAPGDINLWFINGDNIYGELYTDDQLNLMGTYPWFWGHVWTGASSVNYDSGADSRCFRDGITFNAPPVIAFWSNHVERVRSNALSVGGLSLTGNWAIAFSATGTNGAGRVTCRRWSTNTWSATTTVSLASVSNIYVTGYVTNVGGTVDGVLNLATSNVIYIASNLVYQSASAPNRTPWTSGFTSNNDDAVVLASRSNVTVMGTRDIEIHAGIVVPGDGPSFTTAERYRVMMPSRPTIFLYGGLYQYRRGIVGRMPNRGFLKSYKFDPNLRRLAPSLHEYGPYTFNQWRE